MSRDIHCNECGAYVGTIRDAKLQKGLVFICQKCNDVYDTDYMDKVKQNGQSSSDFNSIFNDIFKGKYK